jgi:multidrug efflux pump subunit AcrA (membrane-fusion protein)
LKKPRPLVPLLALIGLLSPSLLGFLPRGAGPGAQEVALPPGAVSPAPIPAERDGAVSYEIEKARVERADIRSYVSELGTVGYLRTWRVMSEAGGDFDVLHVKEGQEVKKGQPLLELKSETLDQEKERVETDLKIARNKLDNIVKHEIDLRLADLKLQAERAANDLEDAQAELEDAREKLKRGLIPAREVEKGERRVRALEGASDMAKRRLQSARDGEIADMLDRQKAAVSTLENQLREIEEKRAALKIISPADGMIYRLHAELPDAYRSVNKMTIPENTLVAVIADRSGRKVDVRLFEQDVERLKEGDAVEISGERFPDQKWEGRVIKIAQYGASVGGQASRFNVEVAIESGAEQLRADSSVRCRIPVANRQKVLSVPVEFVMYRDGGKFCRVARAGGMVERPVRTGVSDELRVEILEGLAEGWEVVRYKPILRNGRQP